MRKYLLTPGPVEVPQPVLAAEAGQMESHRCAAFSSLFMGISEKLGRLLESAQPVVILPSSGTGALECAAVNFLGAGDKFISLSCGAFGKRFREIALRTGAHGVFGDFEEGSAPSPEDAAALLRAYPDAKALLVTHNETSTGVTVPVREIIAALPKENRPLILADGVSSVGAMECFPEEWGIDVLCIASQKGLMTPPGLGFVWLSKRALAELERRECPSYYFDLKLHLKYMKEDSYENPYTPPVSLYYALDAALDVILKDGARKWFSKRRRWADSFASGLSSMGYELLVQKPSLRSAGVTAFRAPDGKSEAVRKILSSMGLTTAGDQGALKGKIIRAAHYSDWGDVELTEILGAFDEALKEARQ